MSKTYTRRQKQLRKQPWFNPEKDDFKKFIGNEKEYNACAKKTGSFNYESEALAHAKHFVKRERGTPDLVWHAYECDYCGKWHLSTNTTPSIRKAKLAEKQARRLQKEEEAE